MKKLAWAKNKGKNQENRLYLTRTIQLPLNTWLPIFEGPMPAGTRIWNSCVWESRNARENGKKYPTESELKEKFKRYQSWKQLHSQSAQSVVEEYFEAVRSYAKHKKNGHEEVRPPGFKPKTALRTITWKKQGFEYEKDRLVLKLSRKLGSVAIPLPVGSDVLKLPGGTVLKGVPVEVKVKAIYRKGEVTGLGLHVTWDFGVVPTVSGKKISAYDVNTTLIARVSSEGSQQLIVCRELLALEQYRNKKIADFQERMSRCKERSRRWKALLAAKRRFLKKIGRRIRQLTHSLTKFMAELDKSEGVASSVLGDLTNVRRRSRTGDKGKKASQKINQLPFAQIKQQHSYKCLLRQINPESEKETLSSQTCYLCGTKNISCRVHRGLWRCETCGATIHADTNGAGNTLKNRLFGNCVGIKAPVLLKSPEIYRWNKRYNRFEKVSPRAA